MTRGRSTWGVWVVEYVQDASFAGKLGRDVVDHRKVDPNSGSVEGNRFA
jgi:hypothetical protein